MKKGYTYFSWIYNYLDFPWRHIFVIFSIVVIVVEQVYFGFALLSLSS
jgi:hypothetical protein